MSHNVDLYWHPLSAPARVAAGALNAVSGKVTTNFKLIDLSKGEQKNDALKHILKKGQVPALVDGDLTLIESHAIARYVASKYQDEAHPIYPTDATARAKIDEALEVVRSDISSDANSLVFQKAFAPRFGRPTSEEAITKATENLVKGFTWIESNFFQTSPNFVVGGTFSLADIIFAVSLNQLAVIKYDLTPYPKIHAYFESIKANPVVAKTHEPFYAVLASFA